MADCGICLEPLKNPVSIPCAASYPGHIHCERCLRAYINSGATALESSCPTCRKSFHIATPDFAFVPPKYHDFILPSVRRLYMDIPSTSRLRDEVATLNHELDLFSKQKDDLADRLETFRIALHDAEQRKRLAVREAEDARLEALELRKKHDSLKKRYREVQSRDDVSSLSVSHMPKIEDIPVKIESAAPGPSRPKRALPRSRLSRAVRKQEDLEEDPPQFIKRPRVGRSNAGHNATFEDDV
ncbi:hypothetical protein F5I97DRAFT_1923374 [Phlebopus sp. FC_14]|nr:hypothetical protein F5I97DRAFT_1923374 [Phlebopus sp. FC_14]